MGSATTSIATRRPEPPERSQALLRHVDWHLGRRSAGEPAASFVSYSERYRVCVQLPPYRRSRPHAALPLLRFMSRSAPSAAITASIELPAEDGRSSVLVSLSPGQAQTEMECVVATWMSGYSIDHMPKRCSWESPAMHLHAVEQLRLPLSCLSDVYIPLDASDVTALSGALGCDAHALLMYVKHAGRTGGRPAAHAVHIVR